MRSCLEENELECLAKIFTPFIRLLFPQAFHFNHCPTALLGFFQGVSTVLGLLCNLCQLFSSLVEHPIFCLFRGVGGLPPLERRLKGLGSKANDQLTFKHCAPNDIWLHARHSAGAHVVLRWTSGETPPARDLEQAANLAALHSKARTSGSVPVDWTRRKYVRKPRKAPPGSVQLDRAKTLFVAPDPSLLDRLKDRN